MTGVEFILLMIGIGILAGIISAAAGLASLVTYPSLLAMGLLLLGGCAAQGTSGTKADTLEVTKVRSEDMSELCAMETEWPAYAPDMETVTVLLLIVRLSVP